MSTQGLESGPCVHSISRRSRASELIFAAVGSDLGRPLPTQNGLSAAAPSESRLGEAVMDAEVANCSASKHGPGQSVKFLAAREHIDNQLYALDLCL